jgi:hypothetical protein
MRPAARGAGLTARRQASGGTSWRRRPCDAVVKRRVSSRDEMPSCESASTRRLLTTTRAAVRLTPARCSQTVQPPHGHELRPHYVLAHHMQPTLPFATPTLLGSALHSLDQVIRVSMSRRQAALGALAPAMGASRGGSSRTTARQARGRGRCARSRGGAGARRRGGRTGGRGRAREAGCSGRAGGDASTRCSQGAEGGRQGRGPRATCRGTAVDVAIDVTEIGAVREVRR